MSNFKIFIKTFFLTALILLLVSTLIFGIVAVDFANRKARGEVSLAPIYYDDETRVLSLSFFGKGASVNLNVLLRVAESVKRELKYLIEEYAP